MSTYSLKLSTGNSHLWQWDTGQTVIVSGNVTQVHFARKDLDVAYVAEVSSGKAAIPDALLQASGTLVAYAYTPTNTLFSARWRVWPRQKPETYPYQDTVTDLKTIDERFTDMQEWVKTQFGAPLAASTVAGMTDTSKIYVYTGSETGYTNGNWYYWDGTAWTSGGIYNAVAFTTDDTLSQAGEAADAAAVGSELSNLKSDLNLFNVGVVCRRRTTVDYTADGMRFIYNGEYWLLDGTCTGANQVYMLNSPNELPASIKPSETVYVYFETDIVGVHARIWPYINGEQQPSIYDSNKSGEVVIPEGTTGIRIALFVYNGTIATNQTVHYYLLSRKPSDKAQEDIQADLDKTKETVNQIASTNMFDVNTIETGVYLSANGTKYFQESGGITDFIEVQPNDNYAVAFTLNAGTTSAWYLRIHGYDNNKQWVEQVSTYLMQANQTGNIFHSFLIPNGISYIKVSVFFYTYTTDLQIGKNNSGIIVTAIDRTARESIEKISSQIDFNSIDTVDFPMDEFKRTALDFYSSFDTIADWETMSALSDIKQFGVYNGGYVDSHIENYQNYPLRAYFINGRSNYMAFTDGDASVTGNYYKLNSPYTDSGLPNVRPEGFYPRKKIMIVSGMHGDEGGTPNYLKEFIRKLVNKNDFGVFFADYDFCIIPLASPYAFTIDRRETRYYNESTGQIETFNLNRDFPVDGSTPVTNEAKFIESVFNADEYDFVIDLHMLTWDSSTDDIRQGFGCVDTSLASDAAATEKFYKAISEAGEKTEREIKSFYELDKPQQATYTWEGIAGSGVNQFIDYAMGRNYSGSRHKADYVLMTETSTYCHYYSNSATKYNQISCSFGSRFNENVLKNILSLFCNL